MGIKKTVTTSSGISTVSAEGLAFVDGNRITGITSVTDPDDVASKSYADSLLLDIAGQAGKFLTTTDGTNYTWDYVSNYQEFTTPGAQTFTLPSHTNLLFIEAVGGGSGGDAGRTFNPDLDIAYWYLRTSGISESSYSIAVAPNQQERYFLATSDNLLTSTDTITWIKRTTVGQFAQYQINLYGNNTYLTADPSNTRYNTSTNGIIWSSRSYPPNVSSIGNFSFAGSLFIAASGSSPIVVAVSTDAIVWTLRTSTGYGNTVGPIFFGNGIYLHPSSSSLRASTDTIAWQLRTTVPGVSISFASKGSYVNGLYIIPSSGNGIIVSTNSIEWTVRTTGISLTSEFFYVNNNYYACGPTGFASSTDVINWTLRTSAEFANYLPNTFQYSSSHNLYIVSGTYASQIAVSFNQSSGSGGQGGSYTSWYIPRNIVYSDLTVNPGAGGAGGTTDGAFGSVGAATTISWTGPNDQSYTITASSTEANMASSSSSFYTTAGTVSIPQFLSTSSGFSGGNQENRFQPTGGGSGAVDAGTGGSGGAVYQYGTTIQASGGTAGNNGSNAEVVSGLSYGLGGGGGGATVSIAATGGNGVRGGGGGGGAVSGSLFGNGGNGGDGYVKITWW